MDQEKFEKVKEIFEKYHDFIFTLPELMYAGYSDSEITIYIKPEKIELAKEFIAKSLDGVPVKLSPKTTMPLFLAGGD